MVREGDEKRKERRTEQLLVPVTPAEKIMIDKLAPVLYNRKYITRPTITNVVRYSCRAIAFLLAKEIENERLGGEKKG